MAAKYLPLSKEESSQESDICSDTETDTMFEQKVSKTKLNWRYFRSHLITFTFLSILSIVFLGSWTILQESWGKQKLPTPHLPIQTTIFENYSDFSSAPTPENNALWMDLIGPGRGFVSIQNPSQYGLPEGISNDHAQPDVQVYGISMYHQLHCLMMIRDKYWEALDGKLSLNIMETEEGELLTRQMLHINHCFDYIRQGIMCAGDMSLEGAIKGTADLQPTDDLRRINGWGSSHECKNFQASRDWMDANVPGT